MEGNKIKEKYPLASSYVALFLKNVKAFEQNYAYGNRKLMYRGQPNTNYSICPSVFRKNNLQKEAQMVNELKRISPHEFTTCSSQLECLIKMQHYGLPTRLLDVTFNPLVALYFACFDPDEKNKNQPGVVYSFYDYVHSCDENVIERNALLSTYSGSSPEELKRHINDKSDLSNVDGSPNRLELKRLFGEKYHAIVPPLNNERIKRQQGGFLLFGLDIENQINPFQKEAFNIQLAIEQEEGLAKMIVVLPNDKKQILKELDAIGINHAFLFPELEHQASYIKDKYFDS
jgi:hypothetical protein